MDTNTPNKSQSFLQVLCVWALLLLAYLLNFFHSLTTGILQPYLMRDFNIDMLTVTTIGSMYFYWYLLMQIPVGLLVDKFGVRLIAASGTLLAALGTALFAIATEVWLLYVGRSCIGIGTSVIFICIIKFQIAWFKPSIMTTMTGIACFIGTLGGIIAQSPLAYMAEQIGWQKSLYGIALASLLNALAIAFFVKDSPVEKNPDSKEQVLVFKGLLSILANIRTWPAFLLYAVSYGSYVLIVGYSGTAWLADIYGMNSVIASAYIIAAVFGSGIGSVVVGIWSDKTGSRKIPMLYIGAGYILAWGCLAFFGNTLPIYAMGVLLFCIGFFSCAFVVCWACIQEINPKEFGGIAVAVVNMGGFLGPIVLPYIFIYIKSLYIPASPEGYTAAFIGIFMVVLGGFICSFFVKEPHKAH